MRRLDLHMHSTASDGLLEPARVVERAKARGLAGLALTDHDTVAGLPEARRRCQELGLELVTGVELSVLWGERELHLLGYLMDPQHPRLASLLEHARHARERREQRQLERLERCGLRLDRERLAAQRRAVACRSHLARALVEQGYCRHQREAFERWLGADGRAYCPASAPRLAEAAATLHAAGGVAVLAHPRSSGLEPLELHSLAEAGVDGVECVHPQHPRAEARRWRRAAEALGLLVSGGSDDHGQAPGRGDLTWDRYQALCSRAERWRGGRAA